MTTPFDDVTEDELRRRRTVKWTLYGPDVLAAWVAEMDFAVAPPIREAVHHAVETSALGYAPADTTALTSACAGFLSESYGWQVSPARVFLVADVLAGISGALDLFVAPGTGVVVPTPAYPPFFEIIELSGHRVVEAPLRPGAEGPTLDLEAIGSALQGGAEAVLLCNPQNPTGRVFTAAELSGLAEVVEHHGGRVIADEVHAPLVYPGARFVPYASVSELTAAHAVTVTSASKAWNIPGLKCAQVIAGNHRDATSWRALPVHAVADPTPLGIAASTAAYRDGQVWLRDLIAYLDGNRRLLEELVAAELPGVHYRRPEATYLAWLDCAGVGVDDPAGFFLQNAKVALNDGPAFGRGFDRHVRLNFGTTRRLLEKIAHAMGRALRAR